MENEVVLSVIVPVSRRDGLEKLLESLSGQDIDMSSIEVNIVLDSREDIDSGQYKFTINSFVSPSKHPGIKRNIGSAASKGRYLVFLDDDCTVHNKWFSIALDLMADNKVACGPNIIDADKLSKRISRAVTSSLLGSGSSMYANFSEKEVAFYNVGLCNVIMHSYLWRLAGGFNEKADYLMDDKEFFFLLSLKGVKFLNSPDLVASHDERSFPFEFLKYSFKEKLHTGRNYCVYNNIFRKQPVFIIIYAFFGALPFLLILKPAILLYLAAIYYVICSAVYISYIKKDPAVYLFLPLSVLLTNIVKLTGIFLGSLQYMFNRKNYKAEIDEKVKRLRDILDKDV